MLLNADEKSKEYVDGYIVTSEGRVWSTKTKKWLKQFIPTKKANYPEIKLNGTKTIRVHRMVAEMFLEHVVGSDYVNHIDGDKTNNNVRNLEWCTFNENMQHAGATGLLAKDEEWKNKLRVSNQGKNSKIDDKVVIEIFRLYNVEWLTHTEIGEIVGIDRRHVGTVLNRKYWSHVNVPVEYLARVTK